MTGILTRSPLVHSRLVNPFMGRRQAAGGGYTANAVNFDGTNDYLTLNSDLTGAADSKLFTFSVWVKVAADASTMSLMRGQASAGSSRCSLIRTTANQFRVIIRNTGDTADLLNINTSGAITIANGWQHIVGSVDMADTGKRHLYRNDASDLTVNTYTNDTLDLTCARWGVGGRNFEADQKWNGDMADLMIWEGVYVDLSVESARRNFIDASGKPVDPATAVAAYGTPIMLFSGATSTWETNDGSGGGFTENGALTDASTSPSD